MECLTKRTVWGRPFAAVAALCLMTSLSQAQQKLRWKFKAGETLNYSVVQKMSISIKVMGRNIDRKMTRTIDMIWKVVKVETDGTAQLAQTITRVRCVIEGGPFGKIEYDSRKKNGGGAGKPLGGVAAKTYDALVGGEIAMKMSPLGEIKDVKMPKKFLDAIKNDGGRNAGGGFGKDTFKQIIGQVVIVFPASGVMKGKSWHSELDINTRLRVGSTYKYLGTEIQGGARLAKFEMKPTIIIVPKPGRVSDIKVTQQGGRGTIVFNVDAGRLINVLLKQNRIENVTSGGLTIEQTINETTEMKLHTGKRSR